VPVLDVPPALLAYIGPGAGLDLIPQFLSLLALAGLALSAVLLWPVKTFLRWLRGGKKPAAPAPAPGGGEPGEAGGTSPNP
jgi:hypothetical protein